MQEIVDALQVEVYQAQLERIRRKPTENLSAYDTFLRGIFHLRRFTRKDNAESKRFLERAIELDPNFADAHATLAAVELNNWGFGWDLDQICWTGCRATRSVRSPWIRSIRSPTSSSPSSPSSRDRPTPWQSWRRPPSWVLNFR